MCIRDRSASDDTWANRKWSIDEPDLVLTALAEFDVPAEGLSLIHISEPTRPY